MTKRSFFISITVTALVCFSGTPCCAAPPVPQNIVVHMKHSTDNLHAVVMAFKLAAGMQKKGAAVTLFLNLEAARLADKRQPLELRWGSSPTLAELLSGYLKAGGRIFVCPHCAAAAGLQKTALRDGMRLATEEDIVSLLLAADKILDY